MHTLDLADLQSVRVFADRCLECGRPLDIVINNAGVMACPETRVGPGWKAHFAINHLGHCCQAKTANALFAVALDTLGASSSTLSAGLRD